VKITYRSRENFAPGFNPHPADGPAHRSGLNASSSNSEPVAQSTTQSPSANSDDEWEDGYANHVEKRLRDGSLSSSDSDDADTGQAWGLPEDASDIDLHVLSALPQHIRKTVIEDAR
jgi:hypothetical protein